MHDIIHYEPWNKVFKTLNLSQASIARKIAIKWIDFVYISLFLLFLAETQMFFLLSNKNHPKYEKTKANLVH
jgi:hypothetical protein